MCQMLATFLWVVKDRNICQSTKKRNRTPPPPTTNSLIDQKNHTGNSKCIKQNETSTISITRIGLWILMQYSFQLGHRMEERGLIFIFLFLGWNVTVFQYCYYYCAIRTQSALQRTKDRRGAYSEELTYLIFRGESSLPALSVNTHT